jgi:hypothetical protein
MFVYLKCSTLWSLNQWTGPLRCLQNIILDLNSGIWRWSIMTAIYPYMTDLRITHLDTIFRTYHKVSQTLWVVMKFYNYFTNSHCVMFIYLECGTSWTLCHQTGPSQCLQYIILDLNSRIYGDQLWHAKTDCDLLQLLCSYMTRHHNLGAIFLMCHKISPTLRVMMMFYNSFIQLCSHIWNVAHRKPFVTGQGHQWIVDSTVSVT